MLFLEFIIDILAGGFVGFVIGMTGVGGGIIIMPVLRFLGLPLDVAVGTSSLYSFIVKIYAYYRHHVLKSINYSSAIRFLTGAVPGVLISSFFVSNYKRQYPHDYQNFSDILNYFIVFAICLALIFILLKPSKDTKNKKFENLSFKNRLSGILLGFMVGFIMGGTGVGGGALIIPVLIIFFSLNTINTVGTSIFIALIVMMVSSVVHISNGNYEIKTALLLISGSFIGTYFGAELAKKTPDKMLRKIIMFIIIISAILMLIPMD